MLDKDDLMNVVIIPTLRAIGLYSDQAAQLLIATAIQESSLRNLIQKPRAIARGLWECESPTYVDLKTRLTYLPDLESKVLVLLNMKSLPLTYDFLAGNLYAACIFARLKYYFIQEKLPELNDFTSMGEYWGKYYNTKNNPTEVKRFISNCNFYKLQM